MILLICGVFALVKCALRNGYSSLQSTYISYRWRIKRMSYGRLGKVIVVIIEVLIERSHQ